MKKRKFISLKFKLTIIITLLLGLLSLFIFIYFPQKFEEEKLKSLNEKVNSIAKITAFGISSGMYFDDYDASAEEISAIIKSESLEYVIILKDDSLYYEYNKSIADSCKYNIISRDEISDKLEILKSHAPVTMENEIIGDLFIGYSLTHVNTKIKELSKSIAIVSIALFLVGSVLVYFVGYYFTRPLAQMFDTVSKISDGDLKQRTIINSNDEVGYLGESFNEMLDEIENTNIEMETINGELEQRVEDRTIELQDTLHSLEKTLSLLEEENEVRKKAEIEISESLKAKEIMLKEIHHRVKNNLQVVSSLLFFQSKKITDPKTLEIFREGENRVKSMALIHEKLYKGDDLANIDFKEYVKNLSSYLLQSYGVDQSKFKMINGMGDIKLGIDTAVPCGLIINELITNSFKHGFKGQTNGEIKIDMGYDENNNYLLKVSDNGKGLPEGLKIEESDSLGLRLVNNLIIQLNGKVEYSSDNGTTVKLVFEDPKYKKAS